MSRPSILDLITARRVAAQCDADRLREQITALAGQLTIVETELAELATTRTTLLRLTGDPDPDADTDYHQPGLPADPRRVRHHRP